VRSTCEYRYKDPKGAQGPITAITIRNGKKVTIAGAGNALPFSLDGPDDPGSVSIVMTTGDRRYCTTFGGRTKLIAKRHRFVARRAAAPAACAPE
jgi:hypothetical protein